MLWGTWVAQLIRHPILDFGSGHDLRVVRLSPGARLHTQWGLLRIFSLPLPFCPLMCSLSLSRKINKILEKKDMG